MKRSQSSGKLNQPKKQYDPSRSTGYVSNPASVFQPVAKAGEKKDVTVTNVTFTSTTFAAPAGALTLLNGMVYGGTSNQHIGRSVTLKSINLNACLGFLGGAPGGSVHWRILIIYDRQPNATAPAVTDILLADNPASPLNLSNSKRFKVLHDWRPEHAEPAAGAGLGGPSVQHQFYRKLQLPQEFNTASSGTIADITTGSIYALTYMTATGATAPTASSYCYSRVRFTD